MTQRPESIDAANQTAVFFMYTGGTQISIRGLVSGTLYSFHHPGAVVQVDPRDINSLKAYPSLKLMTKETE